MSNLGKDTGSLVNYLMMNGKNAVAPEVGMGATICGWSDRHPATIHSVKNVKGKVFIEITEDLAVRTDNNGMSESQTYEYTSQPDGYKNTYRFNEAKGRWDEVRKNETSGRCGG